MGFEMAVRTAQRLAGMVWEGSYEAAAAGEVKRVITDMEDLRGRLAGDGKEDGLIGISWNDIPGGFRYLVALPPALTGRGEREGLASFSFPEMRFASAWHDAGDGDVFAHYNRMFEWITRNRLKRDTRLLHHREEYPAGLDLDGAPVLRLMTPVMDGVAGF